MYDPAGGGDDVADDGLGTHHEATGPDTLDGSEADELAHRVGEAGEGGAHQEDDDGRLEELLAAVKVAELSPDRGRDGQVRR